MEKWTFDVKGMHCASCAANVEKAVKKLEGASEVYVNFAANRLALDADPAKLTQQQVIDTVRAAGFEASLPGKRRFGAGQNRLRRQGDALRELRRQH